MTYSGAGLIPVIYCQEYEGNCRMKLATYLILMKNGLVSWNSLTFTVPHPLLFSNVKSV